MRCGSRAAAADSASYKYTTGKRRSESVANRKVGGTGAVELAACLMALRDGVIAPNIGYHQPDPDCAVGIVFPEARQANVGAVLSNAFAFGGLNAVIALRRA